MSDIVASFHSKKTVHTCIALRYMQLQTFQGGNGWWIWL